MTELNCSSGEVDNNAHRYRAGAVFVGPKCLRPLTGKGERPRLRQRDERVRLNFVGHIVGG